MGFRSPEQALQAVRELRHSQGGALRQPVTVYLHGGVYTLAKPLEFTPEDSGTAENPVTWAAFEDEHPVLSGGCVLRGWKDVVVNGRKLWAMDIPSVREGKWYFHELWINGRRCQRARNPNDGFFRVASLPDFDPKAPYQRGQKRFVYAGGDIQAYDNLQDVEIVALHFWTSTRSEIASLDESKHLVNLKNVSTMRLTDGFGREPELARYFVENAFELLDSPGEWYLNRKTGTLYYMPRPGEEIAHAETVAPVLERLLTLTGDPRAGRLVEHVTFRGIGFSHVEWWLPDDATRQRYLQQGSVDVPAESVHMGPVTARSSAVPSRIPESMASTFRAAASATASSGAISPISEEAA